MRPLRLLLPLILAFSIVWVVPAQIPLDPGDNYGVGIPGVFLPKYLAYRAQQLTSANPSLMSIPLGYVKGLSRSFIKMSGQMDLDLDTGNYRGNLAGLSALTTYTVWLVDEQDGLPDVVSGLATLLATESSALLTGVLGALPLGFTIDRVVVTPGTVWGAEPLAAGSVNVFQKIFFRRLTLVNNSTGAVLFDETTLPPALFGLVPDLVAQTDALLPALSPLMTGRPVLGLATTSSDLQATSSATSDRSVKLDKLISQGADLFFNGTFGGNGRTCGTCHPASNHFTIDPAFIATLPANDPLFVAEFNPALANLEKPALMRQFGLILENVDGFSDPVNKFVMRGVPHTLGLQVSLERDTSLPSPPVQMTGWSADGAPGTGSLREFATGAVTQHFTKSLNRISGQDFTLPTSKQLDAMEAFQLSLGRDKDFDVSNITFNDANANPNVDVDGGRKLFLNGTGSATAGGRCAACHGNAGALAANGQNRNFNTNVEDAPLPARGVQNFPRDGGFGSTPANSDATFGNRTFNTPPVVEAAESAPFFHNNLAKTLDDVVNFYNGPVFNNPQRPAGAQFKFTQPQLDQLVAFMRAINVLQNIDVAARELQEILALTDVMGREANTRLQTAFEDTQDGIEVLNGGGLYPAAVPPLTRAQSRIAQAQQSTDAGQRRSLVQLAIAELSDARGIIATP
jgi:cytochrome c peroxidase